MQEGINLEIKLSILDCPNTQINLTIHDEDETLEGCVEEAWEVYEKVKIGNYIEKETYKIFPIFQQKLVRQTVRSQHRVTAAVKKYQTSQFAITWSPQCHLVQIKAKSSTQIRNGYFGSMVDWNSVVRQLYPQIESFSLEYGGKEIKGVSNIKKEYRQNGQNFIVDINIIELKKQQQKFQTKTIKVSLQVSDLNHTFTFNIDTQNDKSFNDILPTITEKIKADITDWEDNQIIKIKHGNNIYTELQQPFRKQFGDKVQSLVFQIIRQYIGGH